MRSASAIVVVPRHRALALALVLAAALTTPAAGQFSPRQMGGVGITVYSDSDFRGRNATYREAIHDLAPTGMNDRISSLEVAPGEMWEVCEHSNFRGRCQVFSGREPELRRRGWSDIISSMRPVRSGGGSYPGPPVTPYPPAAPPPGGGYGLELYDRAGYRGDRRLIQGPVASLRALGFDNRAESLRLGRGESWEVCEDVEFRACQVVSSDWPSLDRLDLRRRISSVRPWRQGGPGYPPPAQPGRLVLYDREGYRGQLLIIDHASPYVGSAGRRAESVRVEGGAVWEICERAQFQGRCTTVSQSVPDLDRLGLRDGVGSARPR
jgi:hypothetical protein